MATHNIAADERNTGEFTLAPGVADTVTVHGPCETIRVDVVGSSCSYTIDGSDPSSTPKKAYYVPASASDQNTDVSNAAADTLTMKIVSAGAPVVVVSKVS